MLCFCIALAWMSVHSACRKWKLVCWQSPAPRRGQTTERRLNSHETAACITNWLNRDPGAHAQGRRCDGLLYTHTHTHTIAETGFVQRCPLHWPLKFRNFASERKTICWQSQPAASVCRDCRHRPPPPPVRRCFRGGGGGGGARGDGWQRSNTRPLAIVFEGGQWSRWPMPSANKSCVINFSAN